ncbi:AAA family ATPase [Trichococcus shcherbakoviae]|uniref:Nuclease SbcCD subunit C n=1 Tax=Trichococcus shcherbakoviae subsp. psychrophilus TaxID=2585775 RepID=A0A5C5E906_9LACT|nr:SMC family ATPase [Trichococcus shcherbakoviae]TNV69737.1 SMC family ATPase [Trichococcus shcherbakoviae subsp. psychrophilus]
MKLKKLVINNFRNYIGEVSFDLSKDIIILYGDNGNGKSSFFDAIEWCITGEISRFSLHKNEYKSIVANNNMVISEECSVAIHFDKYVLKKSFKINDVDTFSPILTSLYTDELIKIASGEENVNRELGEIVSKKGNGRWDNKILSKAYILSQTQVANFITKDTPRERYNALASIMGFEKINNLKINLSRTTEVLSNKISLIEKELEKVKINKKREQEDFNLGASKIGVSNEEITEQLDINRYSKKLSSIKNNLTEIKRDEKYVLETNFFEKDDESQLADLINKLSSRVDRLEEIKQDSIIKKSQISAKIEQLNKEKTEAIQEEEVLSKNEKDHKVVSKLLVELKNNDMIYDKNLSQELKHEINNVDLIFPKIVYSFDNSGKYIEYKKKLSINEIEIAKLKKENINTEIYLKQIKISITELVNDFSEGTVSTNIEKLLSLIEDTQIYISNNSNFGNICPICDSHVDNISIILNKKIKDIVSESGKQKELIELNIDKRKELEKRQKEILDRQLEINRLIKDKEQLILDFKSKINGIENNILYDTTLFSADIKNIQSRKTELELKSNSLNNNLLVSNKIDAIRANLSKFENNSFEFRNVTVTEINDQIKEWLEKFRIIERKIDDSAAEIELIRKSLNEMNLILSEIQKLFSKYECYSISKLKNYLEAKSKKIGNDEQKIENIISEITNINELSRIKKVIKELEDNEIELSEIKKYFLDKTNILNTKIKKINMHYGDQTSGFLNSIQSPIRRYYQYLNPNPSEFDELYFDIKSNNELEIQVKNDNNNVVANYMLSSGQLNVLAISIFIATNTAQTFSFFDFIAIDDPIQNMDDINRFSITDVLSQLNQQLIFSTHDSDYVNLFIKKNENRLDDIAVFHLDSENNSYHNIVDYSNIVADG